MRKTVTIVILGIFTLIGILWNGLCFSAVRDMHGLIEPVSYTDINGKARSASSKAFMPIAIYAHDIQFLNYMISDYADGMLTFRQEALEYDNQISQNTIDKYNVAVKIDGQMAERIGGYSKETYPLLTKNILKEYAASRDEVIDTLSMLQDEEYRQAFDKDKIIGNMQPKMEPWDIFIGICTSVTPIFIVAVFLNVFAAARKGK